MKKEISYCPISKDYYLLMKDLLGTKGIQRVLMAVCDDFFGIEGEPEFEFEDRNEDTFYQHLLDWADKKYGAWYRGKKNFIESNPKKNKEKESK